VKKDKQIAGSVIFGFLARYPEFWFIKISIELNSIYKIPKFHITLEHPTDFKPPQILDEGT
jgi:hypothetical protein